MDVMWGHLFSFQTWRSVDCLAFLWLGSARGLAQPWQQFHNLSSAPAQLCCSSNVNTTSTQEWCYRERVTRVRGSPFAPCIHCCRITCQEKASLHHHQEFPASQLPHGCTIPCWAFFGHWHKCNSCQIQLQNDGKGKKHHRPWDETSLALPNCHFKVNILVSLE